MRDLPTMHDVVNPEHVEISFSANGRTMWINVDDVCYMRVTNAGTVECDNLILTKREEATVAKAKAD